MTSIEHTLLDELLLIFFSTSVVAVVCLYLRQAIIIAYIIAGFVLGSSGLGIISDASWIEDLGSVGIVYLLFLMGLNLRPQKAISLFSEALFVTMMSIVLFVFFIAILAQISGLGLLESLVVATATAFSSTIIGLKLLPTTTLHHKRRGEMIIAVLLLQDFIAIAILLVLTSIAEGYNVLAKASFTLLMIPIAVSIVVLFEKYVVDYLIKKFDELHEFIFLLVIGWCSICALSFEYLNLSYEVGGFIAGVALASSPMSQFFAEKLKPVRDFFLVLFFFALGASFNRAILEETILMASLLAVIIVLAKPYIFTRLFNYKGETKRQAREVGIRLGQAGEFGILLGITAFDSEVISAEANHLIQLSIVLSMIFSSVYISSVYPTPNSVKPSLRKD